MATKTGRNDPCACGSGKKYKRCCLEKDQQAEHVALAATAAKIAADKAKFTAEQARFAADLAAQPEKIEEFLKWGLELEAASNAVVDLIHEGSLDQAEQAARDLLTRFPDVHDGHDRLGMLYEARGDHSQAVEHYRQALKIVRAHPDDYEPQFAASLQSSIDKLDPGTTT